MKLNINDCIFNNAENLIPFRRLLYMLCDNNYHDFFCELENIENLPLFENLDSNDKSLIFNYYEKILLNPKSKFDIEITDTTTDTTFNLEESTRYLQQPVSIVLENSNNDRHFLEALFRNFKGKSKKIISHKTAGDLIYLMGGGKENIKHLLSAKMEEFNHLSKPNYKYLRLLIIFDSDKTFPLEESKNKSFIEYLNSLELNYHELEKREMENYLPDEIFNDINDPFCIKYLEMNPLQKDFFDIEKGFPNIRKIYLDRNIQELYNDISDANYGFFRTNKFKIAGNFKAKAPLLFKSELVNRLSLKSRVEHQSNPDELELILDKINELL